MVMVAPKQDTATNSVKSIIVIIAGAVLIISLLTGGNNYFTLSNDAVQDVGVLGAGDSSVTGGDSGRTNNPESNNNSDYLSPEELRGLIDNLRGDDHRLMRWDATSYTSRKQHNGGCAKLIQALNVVTAAAGDPPAGSYRGAG